MIMATPGLARGGRVSRYGNQADIRCSHHTQATSRAPPAQRERPLPRRVSGSVAGLEARHLSQTSGSNASLAGLTEPPTGGPMPQIIAPPGGEALFAEDSFLHPHAQSTALRMGVKPASCGAILDQAPKSVMDHLPSDLIRRVLKATGKQSIRRRRMPADLVLWHVVAQSLYRDNSKLKVMQRLNIGITRFPGQRKPTKSTVIQAQARLGPEPVEALFHETGEAWADNASSENRWKGLTLMAMDGSFLRVPDTNENWEAFGGPTFTTGVVAQYLQLRLVALTSLHTRIVTSLAFGEYKKNEMRFAEELIGDIPDHSLTVFDKGFFSAGILETLRTTGVQRHFIIPCRVDRVGEILSGSPDDRLVRMRVNPMARKKFPSLPLTWTLREITVTTSDGSPLRLMTSLLDPSQASVEEIATIYRRRWECETCFAELKVTMAKNKVALRSKLPEGVHQEVWGMFIAYNLVRYRMALDAVGTAHSPTDRSFTDAHDLTMDELLHEAFTAKKWGRAEGLDRRRKEFRESSLKRRPGRKNPREVKRPVSRYPFQKRRRS